MLDNEQIKQKNCFIEHQIENAIKYIKSHKLLLTITVSINLCIMIFVFIIWYLYGYSLPELSNTDKLSAIFNFFIAVGTISLAIFGWMAYKYAINQYIQQKSIERLFQFTTNLERRFNKFNSKFEFNYGQFIPLFNNFLPIYNRIIENTYHFDGAYESRVVIVNHLKKMKYFERKCIIYIQEIHYLCARTLGIICKFKNIAYTDSLNTRRKFITSLQIILKIQSDLRFKIRVLEKILDKQDNFINIDQLNFKMWINNEFTVLNLNDAQLAIDDIWSILLFDSLLPSSISYKNATGV